MHSWIAAFATFRPRAVEVVVGATDPAFGSCVK
jgi:hypothetical protein